MCLIIDPKAKPTAYHLPMPVPIHWEDDVKAGQDRDVRLGILEPVPIGQPVTWYHRMVICAKKNGKPRRTIDFQSLNIHGTWEKLIIPSPLSTKPDQSLMERRKQYLMLGRAIIVFHSIPTTTTIPHLLPPGADIGIALHLRDILLQGMDTQGVMMKLWHHSHKTLSV